MTRRHSARRQRRARPREAGIAFVIALFAVATLLVAASTAFLVGSADVRATRNYRGAAQVHIVAESAIQHALQVVNGPGIVSFQNEVVNQWPTKFGVGPKPFGPIAGYTYTVQALASPANPSDLGTFVATANGPEGVRNVVVAQILRTNIPNTSPGAVYLAQDAQTDATFKGTAFMINGNDRNFDGTPGPNAPIPGISTRNDANTQEAISSLGSGQATDVQGLGYLPGPPTVPSVMTSGWAPSVDDVNSIASSILTDPQYALVTDASGQINGGDVFGTVSAPQVTHFTGNTTMKAGGNASGAGIMIVDGDLTITGNFSFKGLLIVRGSTNITDTTGNASVYGSLWTNEVNLQVGGSALIQYSSQGLTLAGLVGPNTPLPAPIQVTALVDCSSLPPATGGCP
jgi:hypothetical protein